MKKIYIMAVFLALIIGVTSFILYNSSKNPTDSYKDSDPVAEIVKPLVDKSGEKPKYEIDYIVRKSAHTVEYLALGFSVAALVFFVVEAYKKQLYGFGLFYILAVGVVDEYIQLFNGRNSGVKDIIIDFVGGLLGIALALSIYLIYKFIVSRKNKKIKHLEE